MRKHRPGRKKRRRRIGGDENGLAPPPTKHDGWSDKKTGLVLLVLFGLPVVILLSIGRSDILKALGYFLALPAAIIGSLLRYIRWDND